MNTVKVGVAVLVCVIIALFTTLYFANEEGKQLAHNTLDKCEDNLACIAVGRATARVMVSNMKHTKEYREKMESLSWFGAYYRGLVVDAMVDELEGE